MIKKYYWLVFILVLMGSAKSEAQTHTKADRLFESGSYYGAYEEYFKELRKEIERGDLGYTECRIGECFLRMNRYVDAMDWLEKAERMGYEGMELYGALGEVCLTTGDYRRAKSYLLKYKQLNPEDKRVEGRIESCEWGVDAPKENKTIKIARLPYINTRGSEYGISFIPGGLIYSSTGDLSLKRRGDLSNRTGLPCSKPYLSTWQDGEFQPGVLLKGITRDNANEGTFSFDKENNQLYYTRCLSGERNCNIISAQLKINKFKEIGAIRVENGDYSILHPFVTDGGERLYFASDRKGGVGGTDIWYVDRVGNEKWGEPVNAGIEINSAGNEGFPYMWNGVLYFSSDGHVGYGGIDIYCTKIGTDVVDNMGAGLNTSYDDFNLIMDESGARGLFVSNRSMESGDDVFQFEMSGVEEKTEDVPEAVVAAVVYDNDVMDMVYEEPKTEVANIQGYEYRVPTDWWVQVAMLRQSLIIDRSLALKVYQLTGRNVKVFESGDGGRYFYVGEYIEEMKAREVVGVLKSEGIDCFIKNSMK